MIRRAEQTSSGHTAVHVTGLSELVRNKQALFLDDIDRGMRVLKPEETQLVVDRSPGYRRTRLYLESLLRQSPPTDARLYRGHRGAMNPADYQLAPAGKALTQPRPRLLIADAVGLGKTIEVGILLSELIRRGRGRRILVVALKSVLEQFQEELWARFTIPLVRLDSTGLERVQRKIPANHNPFYYFDRVIISIDTLKKDEKYRRFLEQCHWDAVVVDECQHVAVRSAGGPHQRSQRAKLANLLARTSEALILTSATPHDGKKESFASLMNLLDPTAIADDQDYTAEDVQGLFVRRFKKDVQHEVRGAFSERQLESHSIDASPEEDAVFELLNGASFRTIHPRRRQSNDERPHGSGILFRTLLLKAFLSSPQALRETVQARLRHPRLADPVDAEAQHDVQLLQRLDEAAARVTTKRNAKLQALIALLRQMGVAKDSDVRVVVFSERIATLNLLQTELAKALKLTAQQIALFHGSLDDQSQQHLVKDFGSAESQVRLLLASDAASEGVNLHHFCHRMVHYDIPWSLITLEQRNGRIDRFGQSHRPELHYLLVVPADVEVRGDLRVIDVLIEKEQAAHQNLGDAQWLMRLHSPEAEADRVAEGISQKEDPESLFPDPQPDTDFLSVLMGLAQAPKETTLSMWGDEVALTSPSSTQPPECREPLQLFDSDLQFAKEAFAELITNQPEGLSPEARLHEPDWDESIQGFILNAPADLQQRYRYLPPELQRDKGWVFRLTTDRDRVQRALEQSRQSADAWPKYELFWEQHPIAEWLCDRMAAHFMRHEAPVLTLQHGLAEGEAVFVFQGVLSNRRSQPMLAEWFAVHVERSGELHESPLRELVSRLGLNAPLVNPGKSLDTAALEALRPQVVTYAEQYMARARDERRQRLMPVLKEGQKRVKAWAKRKLAEIDARVAKASSSSGKLRKDLQQRYEAQRAEVEQQLQARDRWLKETLSTVETPYLRIAAVLVSGSFD